MKSLTSTSHAVLGLLGLRPWTTYELAKQVQRSLGWFWPRAERKLYEEPKRLVAHGLARATEQRTGNRPRTMYAITADGREALRAWLDAPSAPPTLEFEAMVKVFFADGGTLDQLRATLEAIEATARERIGELHALVASMLDDEPVFAERMPVNTLAMRFQLGHEEHVAEWAAWALTQIDGWRSTTDAGGWDWRAALAE